MAFFRGNWQRSETKHPLTAMPIDRWRLRQLTNIIRTIQFQHQMRVPRRNVSVPGHDTLAMLRPLTAIYTGHRRLANW